MPITDYHFENRIFFAKESGDISKEDAQQWVKRLQKTASSSELPIVALVDVMEVHSVLRAAEQLFIEGAYTENLLAVLVATNAVVSVQARTIGLLGKRGHTRIFNSLDDARSHAEWIVSQHKSAPV